MAVPLRVYPVKEEPQLPELQPATVKLQLGEILPILSRALKNNSTWLNDFLDDPVVITPDFYEILRAYDNHRPAA